MTASKRHSADIASKVRKTGLLAGPVAAVIVLMLPVPSGLPEAGLSAAALGTLMAIWWMSEALPLAVTALAPLVLLPFLGVAPFQSAAQPYANPLIFLFLGGFILAKGLERWQLHRRLALKVLSGAGQNPRMIIAGLMAITAFLSMWVSNTATSMVMLPIALSVAATVCGQTASGSDDLNKSFAPALMLSIAYGATIGGMGTLIGTPPNALFAGFLQDNYGIRIGFAEWMLVGIPAVLVLLPLTWILLVKVTFDVPDRFPHKPEKPEPENNAGFPPMSRQEYTVAGIMTFTAICWLLRPFIAAAFPDLPLSDAGIAMAGACLLFVVPDDWSKGTFLLRWQDVKDIRWDVLILFGGGLSLANAISSTGLAEWIGSSFAGLDYLPMALLVLTVMIVIVYLGELASNTAMAA